jgi:ATP-dependent DNA helicase RecG
MNNLTEMKGIGPKGLQLLSKLGIDSKQDLLEFYPFRYNIIKRSDLDHLEDDHIILDGVIETVPKVFYINKKLNKLSFTFNIGSRLVNVSIFNRAYLKQNLKIGSNVTVIGKIDKNLKNITASEIRFGRIVKETIEPVYHTTAGLTTTKLSNMIQNTLKEDFEVLDYIPTIYQDRYHFIDKKSSILEIHHPTDKNKLKRALQRLKYEELFLFMMKMKYLKENKTYKIGLKRNISFEEVEKLIETFPFSLTPDQRKSVQDIYDDLTSDKRMNRLLQGDVGSGKTIIAITAMYMNYLSGYQSCLMAPTEILAIQHYNTVESFLSKFGIKIVLLTGKMKAKERREVKEKIAAKEVDIIIGTHALFTEDVIYNNLGLVITDEQHRFGVNQRGNLKNKGIHPDVLYMSATPIPRTYALTLYGDMDISSIKTAPNGRKEIVTTLKKESEIKDVLTSMLEELKKHHQIYVIAPLIEESDKMDLENVYELEEKMNKAFGKYYKIGILHGKMKPDEKEEVMDKFQNHEIDILISTTVIEVGINVPNATMMVIFDSFQFGLSALHQLRGRVGRGDDQSYCILISNYETERLNILTKTNDGFKVSEEDFKLRGSGDVFGVRQSGTQIFKLADFKEDYDILRHAKIDAETYYDSKEYENNFILQELLKKNNDLD